MIKIGQDWYFYACHVMNDGQMNCRYFKMFIDSNDNIKIGLLKIKFSLEKKIRIFYEYARVHSMSILTFMLYTTLLSIVRGV